MAVKFSFLLPILWVAALSVPSVQAQFRASIDRLDSADAAKVDSRISRALSRSVRNAQLVGIGESGHAVGEFHRWRARIAQTLISRYGYRRVLIEDDVIGGAPITNAIRGCATGETTSEKLREAFNAFDPSTYRHQEFFPFIEWLCRWNEEHPKEAVSVSGIDLWDQPWVVRQQIRSLLDLIPELAKQKPIKELLEINNEFQSAYRNCYLWSHEPPAQPKDHRQAKHYRETYRPDPNEHALCVNALINLAYLVSTHRALIVERIGESHAIQLESALDEGLTRQKMRDIQATDLATAFTLRDAFQARQTARAMGSEKSILLAHNVHIGKKMSAMRTDVVSPSDEPMNGVFISAGESLRGKFGRQYVSIGVGGLELASLRDGAYPTPSAADSLDVRLSRRCKNFCLIRLEGGLFSRPYTRELWMHNETSAKGMWGRPSEQYDYYLFIRKSAAATAMPDDAPK